MAKSKFPKIDPSLNSAVYIWEILFYTNFPNIAMDSATYIREVGIPMSGIKQLDKELENAWRQSYLCIGKMAEMISKGYSISLHEPDTKVVYEYIQHHLKRCIERIQYEYSPDEEMINELFILDQLSGIVYPYAKPFFDGFTSPSQFCNKIRSGGFSGLATASFLAPYDAKKAHASKPSKWDTPEQAEEKFEEALPDPMEGHRSLSDELSSFLDRTFLVK